MRKFARIQDGRVVELFTHPTDISSMFHPALVWLDVSSMNPTVAEGWNYDGVALSPPVRQQTATAPTILDDLQRQILALTAQVESMKRSQASAQATVSTEPQEHSHS